MKKSLVVKKLFQAGNQITNQNNRVHPAPRITHNYIHEKSKQSYYHIILILVLTMIKGYSLIIYENIIKYNKKLDIGGTHINIIYIF